MKAAQPALSVKAWTSAVEHASRGAPSSNSRMLFTLESRETNDVLANQIAEAVIFVFELMQGPLLLGSEIELVLRLPFAACSPTKKMLLAQDLADAALVAGTAEEFRPDNLASEIFSCSFVDDRLFGLGWALAPTVLAVPWLHDALAFHSASIRRFYVWDVDIAEERERTLGENRAGLAIAEGAFQDAFKAIEAVVGDPGNGGERFLSRLMDRGITPTDLIGFYEKRTVLDSMKICNQIRDKRSAHGGTRKRGLSVLEVSECQRCAEFVIRCAIDHLTGGDLITRWVNWYDSDCSRKPRISKRVTRVLAQFRSTQTEKDAEM